MNSQQHRDAITGELSGWFDSTTTDGPATGGSFAFTEDQIRAIVKNYLDLADSYDTSITDAIGFVTVDGPGLDFASSAFANAASRSGKALVESFSEARDYCLEQARMAQGALADYLGVEDTNVTRLSGPQDGI